MHLHSYHLRNFRRLKDTRVDLAHDISIFVGSNNSGKTSATQALQLFLNGSKERFSLYDFNAACWKEFEVAGEIDLADPTSSPGLPSIDIDLWFEVSEHDLYLVIPLLPSTSWEGTRVGMRISLTARDPAGTVQRFQEARAKSASHVTEESKDSKYIPWPRSMTDYIQRELKNEYELKYFVLDHTKLESPDAAADYQPDELIGDPGGSSILKSLIQIDNLGAQRHLADPHPEAGARSEDLSKRLSRFYKRNLAKKEDDHSTLRALFESEQSLNAHLAEVFKPTLNRLAKLGYPGIGNPKLKILSAIDPARVMSQDARVHYQIGDDADFSTLPDSYNGLGFKNLIYMVVEILDSQAKWASMENRPPLHLIFVEEPEAHLHAQLQQVFIRRVLELLKIEGEAGSIFSSQMVVTTHSPHIVYERGFKPIRYFRRKRSGSEQSTDVLNLSEFYESQKEDRDFLERYLKLTHCDLFFADAVVLVEGNVERLLLPVMIKKTADNLRSTCLCILEVGGAFGHRFKSLIEFLGITTLVITDIDSVAISAASDPDDEDNDLEEVDQESDHADASAPGTTEKKYARACLPSDSSAVTSNQTLRKWIPGRSTIADLHAASTLDRTREVSEGAKVHVTYQTKRPVSWNGQTHELCGRTLEEDFGLENAEWMQSIDMKAAGLRLKKKPESPAELAAGLHKKVSGRAFDKTRFALAVLTESENKWTVPRYICDGLTWLSKEVQRDLEAELEGAPTATSAPDAGAPSA